MHHCASYLSGENQWFPYDVAMNIIQHSHHTRIHADCAKNEVCLNFLLNLFRPLSHFHLDTFIATSFPLRYLGNEINNARFKLETVSVGYMERAIRALNNSKSPGADRIPVEILKDAVHLVSKPLPLIYNTSLEKGVFPRFGNWPEQLQFIKRDLKQMSTITGLSQYCQLYRGY